MTTRRFGISSHLFQGQRLAAEHLQEIARFGFETVELAATRRHFDYYEPERIDEFGSWLEASGLALHAIHGPAAWSIGASKEADALSIGAADESARQRAVREVTQVLEVARRIRTEFLILQYRAGREAGAGGDGRHAVIRSLQEIGEAAAPAGVRLAIDVVPNTPATVASLVDLLETELDDLNAGICLDVGHARLGGDPLDAVEAASGYLTTMHVHDNDGRRDEHRVPFDGVIDWPGTLTATMKIGYDGAFIFEVGATAPVATVLERTARARRRFEEILAG